MGWDVFISHAWEDKESFARPLAEALRAKDVRVWYDEFTLNVGDSLRRSIDYGLLNSRYGIVILSPHFFAKEWPQKELDGLVAREVSGNKVILPVWHNITAEQIRMCSPILADRIAVSSDRGLDFVVAELLRVITGSSVATSPPPSIVVPASPTPSVRWKNWLVPLSMVVALAIIIFFVARGMIVEQSAESSPPSAATPTLAMQAAPPTPWPSPTSPTLAMQSAPPMPTSIAVVATPPRTATLIATRVPPTPFRTATPIPGLGIGSTKTAKDGASMTFIPAGEFLMGSSSSDKNALDGEKPQHTVYLDAFWISKYEVTNALYKKCMDVGRCSVPSQWANGTIPAGKENHPVVNVSWSDAAAYAQWMGGRLPTEAEWEKAACWDEAKKTRRMYPWGDVFDARKANSPESGIGETTPVGKYSPIGDSPYGVSDMLGNVWEWSADWYSDTYFSNSPKYNPKGPDSGTFRSLRGGSWPVDQGGAHCASRRWFSPEGSFANIGFRVAASVP